MKNQKKIIISIGSGAAVIGVVFLGLYLTHTKPFEQKSTAETTQQNNPTVKLEPATEQERKDAESHKADLEKRTDLENTPTTTDKKQVHPVIASWGQDPDTNNVEITAYVPDIYEDGGTCTLEFTKDSSTITKTTTGKKDVNRTSCSRFVIPKNELTAGTWSASVSYASASGSGASSSQTIEVK